MARKLLLGLLVVLAAVIVGIYVSKNFEYYNEQVQLGWSNEARVKPYLAATKLLESNDIELKLSSRFDNTIDLDEVSTLLLPSASYVPHESQKKRLVEWVKRGGHLITGGENIHQESFLAELGFSSEYVSLVDDEEYEDIPLSERLRAQNEALVNSESDEPEQEAGEICMAPAWECDALSDPEVEDGLLSEMQFKDTQVLYFYADSYSSLDHPDLKEETEAYWSGSDDAITFAQVPVEDGFVSVFSDFSIFENDRLPHFDHAFILFKSLEFSDGAVLIYGWDAPSLFELFRKYFFFTLVSFCVLILFFLWHYGRRFGPVIQTATPNRRAQTERMQARSQFYWRARNEQALVGELRKELEERLKHTVADVEELSLDKTAAVLAEKTGVDINRVYRAFEAKINYQEEQFTEIVSTLKRLREKI